MAEPTRSSRSSRSKPAAKPIGDRVVQRLAAAGAEFDRASRRKGRSRKNASSPLAAAGDPDMARRRERACLKAVFLELGEAHRRYRTQTGQTGTPELRAAAHAFKKEPSVGALIPVAAFLDELGILAW